MWHQSELQQLSRLWRSGQSTDAIAAKLHRGRTGVMVKLRELGLHRPSAPTAAKPPARSASPIQFQLNRSAIIRRKLNPGAHPIPFTKNELNDMLAEAVRNTSRLPH
jgi:hypothetical protein